MFWKDSGSRSSSGSGRDQNGVGPFGQVRVLVVGDSGVGKSSLVHLILKGSAIARPAQTVGCTVGVKHITYGSPGSSSNNISDAERNFFVELWDVSGHERYKACRSIFYTQINGVIFVYDLSQRKSKTNLNKWAVEVAETGTFLAPLGSGGPGGLPVPYLAAKQARYDKEAVIKFFRMLIRRRYFSNEPPAPSPWSLTPREDTILPVETLGDGSDTFLRKSLSGEGFMYNGVVPLPAQRNLAPPPTLNPQQPVSSLDNFRYHRFSSSSLPDASSNRTSREDMNV
nr:unnamed protein product [Digitaria exilis]